MLVDSCNVYVCTIYLYTMCICTISLYLRPNLTPGIPQILGPILTSRALKVAISRLSNRKKHTSHKYKKGPYFLCSLVHSRKNIQLATHVQIMNPNSSEGAESLAFSVFSNLSGMVSSTVAGRLSDIYY